MSADADWLAAQADAADTSCRWDWPQFVLAVQLELFPKFGRQFPDVRIEEIIVQWGESQWADDPDPDIQPRNTFRLILAFRGTSYETEFHEDLEVVSRLHCYQTLRMSRDAAVLVSQCNNEFVRRVCVDSIWGLE